MRNKLRKIIIDTNLFISFLITKDHVKFNDIVFSKECVLIFSDELIEEFIEVARRPKFRRFFSLQEIDELLIILYRTASFVTVKTEVNICRDPKDNFLLSLAVDSKADFLLTGDNDLLILGKQGRTNITTMTDFLKHTL